MKRSFIREILEAIDEKTISFAGGLPDESIFPIKELQKASKKVFKNSGNLQYSQSGGILKLRKQIANFYNKEGFETEYKNILITSGSQQALYIIAKYFANQDIVIESPSYLGAVNIFNSHNLKMKPIDLKHNGINVDQFQTIYKDTKLAYLIPDFQNPKGSLYSKRKRDFIVDIVKKDGGYIIEDAPYSELYFNKKSKSISSSLPFNSFHLGSFSKTLSPALRIGWVRADKDLIEKLTILKEEIDLHSCSISQHILTEYLKKEKRYTSHLKNLRAKYKEKMEYFTELLQKEIPDLEFKKPKGGMFIYGKLKGYDTKELLNKAMDQKIVFVPGGEFYIDDISNNEIRLNFTHSSKKEIQTGIKRLKAILEKNKL